MDAIIAPYETFSADDCAAAPGLDWAYVCGLSLLRQPLDVAISEALQYSGQQANADRAWILEYDSRLLNFRNTHEWCRHGIESFVTDLQNAPTTMIAWLQRYVLQGRAVMINNVDALPRPARTLQAEMQRQSDKSVLSVPIIHDGRLRALIGFDAVRSMARWSHAETKALFQCADLIGQARYGLVTRMPVTTAAEQKEFEPLVYLRKHRGIHGVPLEAIAGVRSANNYSEIWLSDGSMVFDARPLVIWASLLPAATFCKIHRTAIVNLSHVSELDRSNLDKWQLKLRQLDHAWPVSRACRKELRARLGI